MQKLSELLRYIVKTSSDLESNLTSVERIKEYSKTPSEVWIKLQYFFNILAEKIK